MIPYPGHVRDPEITKKTSWRPSYVSRPSPLAPKKGTYIEQKEKAAARERRRRRRAEITNVVDERGADQAFNDYGYGASRAIFTTNGRGCSEYERPRGETTPNGIARPEGAAVQNRDFHWSGGEFS